jgi:hypothetical protein
LRLELAITDPTSRIHRVLYHPWNSWFKDFAILRKTTSEYILDVTLRLRLPHCLVAPARYRFFFLSLGLGVFGWYCAGTNARWVGYNASVHGPGAYGWRRGLRREQRVRNVEASCFSPSIAIWFLPAHDEGFTSGQSMKVLPPANQIKMQLIQYAQKQCINMAHNAYSR